MEPKKGSDTGKCFSIALIVIAVALFGWSYSRLGTFLFWDDCARLQAYCSNRTNVTFRKIGECLAIKLNEHKLKSEHCAPILKEVQAKPWLVQLLSDMGLK